MLAPGVADQPEVVAHQLIASPQGPAAQRGRRLVGAIGVFLPAADAARELQHGALRERLMAATGIKPIGHRGGMDGAERKRAGHRIRREVSTEGGTTP